MATTVDHLGARRRVRVLQPFSDARGAKHRTGERAVIQTIDLDWPRQELVITWEREGATETLWFSLQAKDGPRNGKMREYFEVEGEVAPPPKPAPPPPASVLTPSEEPIAEDGRYEDAVMRVHALVAHHRFDDAEAQVRLILAWPDEHGGVLESLAGDLVWIAASQGDANDREGYRWASDRAISLWHAWGSCATSGGEGAVRSLSIEAAKEKLARHAPRVR